MADADTQSMRAALTNMLDRFAKRRPKRVLFTTFNFSSAFFETNVLPLLAGSAVEELAGSAENAKELNTVLAQVRTLVVCDRSALPEAKGEYRYALMPVGLASGRFHPKVILMSGELDVGGYGLSLAVASANLSLAGWAVNREVVGVTEVAVGHVDELNRLLEWLELQAQLRIGWLGQGEVREEGQPREVLVALRQALKAHARPDRRGDPTLHIGLPTDSTSLIDALAAGGPWRQATAVSPFWGEVAALRRRIGAAKVCFVPSIGRAGQYGFPLDTLSDASADFLRFQSEADRYTHAKALLLEGKQGNVLAIGSANFTGAALLNSEGLLRNVEAMLRYALDRFDPWSQTFTELDRTQISADASGDEEGAPPLPPFYAEAFCDWHERRCHLQLLLHPDAKVSHLWAELAGSEVALEPESTDLQMKSVPFTARRPIGEFLVRYRQAGEERRYRGLVTQMNAEDDDLGYRPRPRLDAVLELLRNLDPESEEGHGGGLRGDASGDDEGLYEPIFDFFPLFQASYKMRRFYARHRHLRPFSNSAPQGLPMLLRAVQLQPAQTPEAIIGRYVQLSEVRELAEQLAPLRRPEDQFDDAGVRQELATLEESLEELLLTSKGFERLPGASPDQERAKRFLNWFRQELKTRTEGVRT